jgi:hypothetical protein
MQRGGAPVQLEGFEVEESEVFGCWVWPADELLKAGWVSVVVALWC